ncbi:MAG TPA: hypothetical protein VMK12_02740 [Anaeromyxobacteraceae bacterium]|nr:hypothetical protein [Anaeromyxobacteraceae bacterium]
MAEQIRAYLTTGLGEVVAFLPNLISAVVIFVIGYLFSRVVAAVVRRVLVRTSFDAFTARHLRPSGAGMRSPSATLASAVFWLGMLVTLSLTANSLRLATLTAGINEILAYVPRVIVAAIIVAVAIAVGNVLGDMMRGMGTVWLSRACRIAIIALAAFMALDQLGVARTVVTTTFAALLGAAAVAAAIAFGVGNIPLAREYCSRWAHQEEGQLGERTAADEEMEQPRPPEPSAPARTH